MITRRAVQRKECDSVPPSIGFHGRGVEGEPFLGFTPLQLTMAPREQQEHTFDQI